MTMTLPGGNNTFVPTFEQKRSLIVDFARRPSSFAINRYTQVVPDAPSIGYYLKLDIDVAARMSAPGTEFDWPDGANRPSGSVGVGEHEFLGYMTRRKSFPFTLGQKGVEQASWDNVERHSRIQQQLAMTHRTMKAISVATNASNYDAANILDVATISAGRWGGATVATPTIRISCNYAVFKIANATLGAVKRKDLMLVISDDCARQISQCQEIVDFIAKSPLALASIRGDLMNQNPNVDYDLPPKLYGMELVIEDAKRITSKRGATRAVTSVLAPDTPFVCARPGKIEGKYGAPSFSTLTCFAHEEMTVEAETDSWNRLVKGAVTEDFVYVMTAPVTGVLFQNAV